MFGKRRYERKKGTRKGFRRRFRKKSKIFVPDKSPEPALEPEKPVFNASGSSLYSWMHIPPLSQRHFEDTNTVRRGKFTRSLREKCAEIVGANSDALSPAYLEEGSWSCWKTVWRAILKNGADSPALFQMFAEKFGNQKTFSTHLLTDGDMHVHSPLRELRDSALNACLVPFHKKHRMENIFSNVSINDCTRFVAGLKSASVIIEASKMPSFTAQEVLSLCNIPTLKGLDLSGNRQIEDQFLYTIKSRLISRSSNLQILILSGCPFVTEKGLFTLLKECGSASLSYVESDIPLKSSSGFGRSLLNLNRSADPEVITGTKWKLVKKEDSVGVASKYKLGMKHHILSRQMETVTASGILWDLKFFSSAMEPRDKHAEDLFCTSWKQRYTDAMSRRLDPPFIYIKDPTIDEAPLPPSIKEAKASTVFKRAGHETISEKKASKKPKRINTNAQAFFFGT